MAPTTTNQLQISPAELAYLQASLSLDPPVRPDGRSPMQFRPLIAEDDVLPSTNGSARVCFADGSEAIVGIKADVQRHDSASLAIKGGGTLISSQEQTTQQSGEAMEGQGQWVEVNIDIPGHRDDDPLPLFLAALLLEALVASGELQSQLHINRRFHWKLYVDILLLSQPLSYPLPLLSITTHLALLSTRMPKLISEGDEDPLFDDDWDASQWLYPRLSSGERQFRPPITLLVITVGNNILFDPSKEEVAVAEAVLAISIDAASTMKNFKILAMRTIDPPSRMTQPGLPNSLNSATGANVASEEDAIAAREAYTDQGVWNPPRGGLPRSMIARIMKLVLGNDGAAKEVMDGLSNNIEGAKG